jgi:hypothetical protein
MLPKRNPAEPIHPFRQLVEGIRVMKAEGLSASEVSGFSITLEPPEGSNLPRMVRLSGQGFDVDPALRTVLDTYRTRTKYAPTAEAGALKIWTTLSQDEIRRIMAEFKVQENKSQENAEQR